MCLNNADVVKWALWNDQLMNVLYHVELMSVTQVTFQRFYSQK